MSMALVSIIKKAHWLLVILIALYFACLTILLNGWAQRHAIYLHKINTAWVQDPNKPEIFGFLKNQVQPFYLRTPDGETLYGWHVLPLSLYAEHEATLLQRPDGPVTCFNQAEVDEVLSLKLLRADPESRLIINFHGNAGTVSQGWRTDTYRSLTSVTGGKVHVLTLDYRGFGYSTGSPTEAGLVVDGVTLVKWAVSSLRIPPDRIIFVGQSLGTAVATAVAEHLAVHENIEIQNIILVAAFSDIPSLLLDYKIAGFIPVLSPLKPYAQLRKFYMEKVQETWDTSGRLSNLIKRVSVLHLHLIHAKDDRDIPWQHSEALFHAAANATSEHGMTNDQINAVKLQIDLRNGGFINSWKTRSRSGGKKWIHQEIVPYGGEFLLPLLAFQLSQVRANCFKVITA